MSHIKNIENEDQFFEKLTISSSSDVDKLIVIHFYAYLCRPCRETTPILNELSTKIFHVSFLKVNIDKFPDIAAKYNVAKPTFLFIKNEHKIDELTGANSKVLESKITQNAGASQLIKGDVGLNEGDIPLYFNLEFQNVLNLNNLPTDLNYNYCTVNITKNDSTQSTNSKSNPNSQIGKIKSLVTKNETKSNVKSIEDDSEDEDNQSERPYSINSISKNIFESKSSSKHDKNSNIDKKHKDTSRSIKDSNHYESSRRQKNETHKKKYSSHRRRDSSHRRRDSSHRRRDSSHQRRNSSHRRRDSSHQRKDSSHRRRDSSHQRKDSSHRRRNSSHRRKPKYNYDKESRDRKRKYSHDSETESMSISKRPKFQSSDSKKLFPFNSEPKNDFNFNYLSSKTYLDNYGLTKLINSIYGVQIAY